MSLLLGLRIAFAGGREGRLRFALMALGTAIAVTLVLLTLIVVPALQGRVDRYAWHRTDEAAAPTAPDPALWLPVTDRFDGRSIVRIQVAALGERPPVPPGLDQLPQPGEVYVSPALAELIATVPADQLGQRFPGELVGLIGPEGLVSPDELVAVIGASPEALRATSGTMTIRGIERPSDRLGEDMAVRVLIGFLAIMLIGPIIVFVMMATRIDTARREQRLAALRLAGATRWQAGITAAAETGGAALLGTGLGLAGFLFLLPILAARVSVGGLAFPPEDLRAPLWQLATVLAGVPLLAIATTVFTMHRAQLSPLGARHQAQRRPPTPRRAILLAVGFGLQVLLTAASSLIGDGKSGALRVVQIVLLVLLLAAGVCQLVGLYGTGVYLSMWVGRGLARLSSRAPALIAARRISADPAATFRAVAGIALAAFVATLFSTLAHAERTDIETTRGVLDDGVVQVLTRGASEETLAPLLARPGVVVARLGPDAIVVPCADLAGVTGLDCPLGMDEATQAELSDLARLPFARDPDPAPPGPWRVVEPSPSDGPAPISALFIPTDGSTAAIERVRTQSILGAPYGLARTSADADAARLAASSDGIATILLFAMGFTMVVAACSLTVSVIASMLERRRPFALLRAAGMPVRDLRQVVLLETTVPLVVTTVVSIAIALLATLAISALADLASPGGATSLMTWPGGWFFASAGIGLAVAVGLSLLSWPLMDSVTRHDSIRYE